MSRMDDIKEKISEAKEVREERRKEVNEVRRLFDEAIRREIEAQNTLFDLFEELREARQNLFDEDGMHMGDLQ